MLTNEARDEDLDDEQTRPTWPSAPPSMLEPSRETWQSCTTLAERIVRLVGGDDTRAVSVDAAIDRAIAECTEVRRVMRRRAPDARVLLDATRLKDLFVALVREIAATTRESGGYARAIAVHTEIEAGDRVVVEIADLRRVWLADAEEHTKIEDPDAWLAADESNARATDAATGIVLSTATHTAFGRLARVEIPRAKR